ncbi:LamG domain-containing protein [Nocardioides marmoraquaticus]
MTRARLAAGILALLLGMVGIVGVPTTSGVLTGRITNTTSTAATGLYPLSCTAAATRTSAWLAYPFAETSRGVLGTVTDVSGNGRSGTYSTAGITYAAAGPCPRDASRAITLNGSTGSAIGPAGALVGPTTGPQVFSVQVWFRTTTTAGGKLVGFGNGTTTAAASTSYDRHVYLTNNGRLVAGVYPNALRTATSTASYNDGAWHHVVATLDTVGTATGGLRLYVDGVLVASDATAPGAQVYNGFWRFGGDNLDTWPNQPTSRYVAGSIAHGAVWTTALSPTQVVELYYAGR